MFEPLATQKAGVGAVVANLVGLALFLQQWHNPKIGIWS